ncbi:MAG: 5'/3'-nucleotidase SurE [Chloroflexi bacterium]|nr:5'/3'-nucleotidase SurE [Chloroflexota bacterium]
MRILACNDDGIYAEGLWALVAAAREVGEVIVVAPDREQSAVGTSVTLHHPLRMKQVKPLISGIETYSVEGTPGDCVILGLKMLARDKVDLVISGINEGMNLGNDVFISGTVGAALQGYFYEIPAIAISTALHNGRVRFDTAAMVGGMLARKVKEKALHPRSLLNVNVPHLSPEEIEGIELTRPGRRSYRDEIQKGNDGKRDYYWIVRGDPVWEEKEGTDITAVRKKKISITPLPGNLPGSDRVSLLKNLCRSLYEDIQPRSNPSCSP